MTKWKILLVDDEQDFRKIMSERITSWGYEVGSVSSGKEAVEEIKNKNADIVILDYMMPQKDGISTLKEIRQLNKEIPVIMFTAHPDEKSIKVGDDLGITAFVPKIGGRQSGHSALQAAINMAAKKLKK
jgi:two-component system alkaline phosphatase synthesis response regulator PhoP